MLTYNPYSSQDQQYLNDVIASESTQRSGVLGSRLSKLSIFGRNYDRAVLMNAKGIHKNEDMSQSGYVTDSNGYNYSVFSRKAYAMMQEKQNIAALNSDYVMKLPILQEYAIKGEIRDVVTKLANEVVVYKKKMFCDLGDFPSNYSAIQKKRSKEIFEDVYTKLGFSDRTYGWDLFRDFLVEGYICKEIIYDNRKKNIIGFQTLDPRTIVPYTDPKSQIQYWIQNPMDNQFRRIFQDAEIIYISYSGSSNYMETSYIEPLIRPYNELKSIERAKLLFNLINATMHKQFKIPTHGMSPAQAEQELLTLLSDYKDQIQFDDTTGITYIDGQKDLPYSKEYWFSFDGESSPEMEIVEPGGHDLNEGSMLIWFQNNFKRATKFPFTRFDTATGGGNIYSYGADVSYDDYNFNKYIARLRTIYKDIILKPVSIQIFLEFPEMMEDEFFLNDLDIIYYGHSEIEKAKELANMQAKASIANDLMNNFKRNTDDKPVFHWKYIAKHVMELTDELLEENEKFFRMDAENGVQNNGTGGEGGSSGGAQGGGSGDLPPITDGGAQTGGDETPAQPGAQDTGGEDIEPTDTGGNNETPPQE